MEAAGAETSRRGHQVQAGSIFYVRRSLPHLVFSTEAHHGLYPGEPRITVELRSESEVRVAYGIPNLHFGPAELEYTLPFEQAFPTFVRFLNQLWTATMPEAIPEDVRRPLALLHVPVLTK
jgi:hypothetical protein